VRRIVVKVPLHRRGRGPVNPGIPSPQDAPGVIAPCAKS